MEVNFGKIIIERGAKMKLKRKIKPLIPIASIFILFLILFGELQGYYIRNYSDKDGLSMNIGTSIVKDKYGYIWIGTQDGVNRFDGTDVKIFTKDHGGLPDNYIQTLYLDDNKNIWVATRGGLALYNYEGEEFTAYTKEKNGLSHNHIRCIKESKIHGLLIGTESGLSILKHGKVIDYSEKHKFLKGKIYAVEVDEDNNITYLGTYGKGLVIYQKTKIAQIKKADGLLSDNIRTLLLEDDNSLWIGTDAGLLLYKNGKFIKTFTTDNSNLSNNSINALYKDEKGNFWVATTDGLNQKKENRFITYHISNGLADNNILSFCEDHEGGLWIGAYGGVSYLGQSKFKTYSLIDGMPGNNCYGIYETKAGKFWVATYGGIGVIDEQNRKDGRITTYTAQKNRLPTNSIRFFEDDDEGNIWIATYAGGLVRYKDKEFKSYRMEHGLPSNNVRFVYLDSKKQLWLGLQDGGLVLFDKRREKAIKIYNTNSENSQERLLNDNVRFIKEDSKGNLWIGLDEGLCKLVNGNITRYTRKDGLVCKDTTGILEDPPKKGYWITTFGDGLYFLNENLPEGNRFKQYTKKDGLPDNCLYGVIEDDEGWLWLPTNKGVCRWDKKQEFIIYTVDNGLPSNENNSHSGFIDKSGRIWFSTPKGVAWIDPKNNSINKFPPPVYIEEIKVNNKGIRFREKSPVLKHNENNIFFKFTALSYQYPEGVKFKIRLDGFHKPDTTWVRPLADNRFVEYTNLPPGSYTFRVKAGNSDSIWNEEGASISFTIMPSFFQTIWFYFLLGIFIFMTFFLLLQYRMIQQKKKEKLLKHQYYRDKMVSLGEMAAALAHEMNNPANYIYGNSDILQKYIIAIKSILIEYMKLDLPEDHKIIQMRKEFGFEDKLKELDGLVKYVKEGAMRIAGIVNDLQYFVGRNDGEPHLVDIHKSITSSLNLIGHRTKDRVKIHKLFGDIPPVEGYSGQLNQVFMNVLSNAVDAIKIEGTITIETRKKNSEFVVTKISDNGDGISVENLSRIFDPFFTTKPVDKGMGLGLFTTRKIIEEHNGNIDVESKLGKGTHFTIILPIKYSAKKDQIYEGDEKQWEILTTSTKS